MRQHQGLGNTTASVKVGLEVDIDGTCRVKFNRDVIIPGAPGFKQSRRVLLELGDIDVERDLFEVEL